MLYSVFLHSFACKVLFGSLHPRVYRAKAEPGTRQEHLKIERLNECTIAFVYCVEWKKQRHAGPSPFTMAHSVESVSLGGKLGWGTLSAPSLTSQIARFLGCPRTILQTLSSDSYRQLPVSRPPPTPQPRNGSARHHLDQVRSDHCAHGRGRPRFGGGIPSERSDERRPSDASAGGRCRLVRSERRPRPGTGGPGRSRAEFPEDRTGCAGWRRRR